MLLPSGPCLPYALYGFWPVPGLITLACVLREHTAYYVFVPMSMDYQVFLFFEHSNTKSSFPFSHACSSVVDFLFRILLVSVIALLIPSLFLILLIIF